MATKNLARTIIEGGQSSAYQYESRQFNRSERQEVRRCLHRVVWEGMQFDTIALPIRKRTFSQPHDRLAPLRRFIRKHTGKSWSQMYGKICHNADARRIRGYHLREHVTNYIFLEPWQISYVAIVIEDVIYKVDRRMSSSLSEQQVPVQEAEPTVPKREKRALRLPSRNRR